MKTAGRDHRADNCRRRRKCMKNMEGDACIFNTCCFIRALQFKLASRHSPSHITLLPVITCKIYGQNGFQKPKITLLDSGAQISLIREETAVTLGLKGNDTAVWRHLHLHKHESRPLWVDLSIMQFIQVLRRCFPSGVTQQCCGATMGGRWLAQSGNCMKWWKVSIQTNSVISALKEASTGCSLLQLLLIRIAVLRHSLKVVSVPKEGNKRAGSEPFRVVHMPARSRKSRKSTAYRPCSKWPGWRQIFVLRWTEAITTEYIFWRTWPAPVSRQCHNLEANKEC